MLPARRPARYPLAVLYPEPFTASWTQLKEVADATVRSGQRWKKLGVKRAVGYCPDVGGLVPRATPWEHLQLSGEVLHRVPGYSSSSGRALAAFDDMRIQRQD